VLYLDYKAKNNRRDNLMDFTKVFTVEVDGPKGWEVVSSTDNLEKAIMRFRAELNVFPLEAVRLTSPTDLSIYGT
jgi:hypothetical protein